MENQIDRQLETREGISSLFSLSLFLIVEKREEKREREEQNGEENE